MDQLRDFEQLEPVEKVAAVLAAISEPRTRADVLSIAGLSAIKDAKVDRMLELAKQATADLYILPAVETFWEYLNVDASSVRAKVRSGLATLLRG